MLIDSGCFDRFSLNRRTLHKTVEKMLDKEVAQISHLEPKSINIKKYDDFSFEENEKREYEVLGMNIKFSEIEDLSTRLWLVIIFLVTFILLLKTIWQSWRAYKIRIKSIEREARKQ